jgi:hypothetical protein
MRKAEEAVEYEKFGRKRMEKGGREYKQREDGCSVGSNETMAATE